MAHLGARFSRPPFIELASDGRGSCGLVLESSHHGFHDFSDIIFTLLSGLARIILRWNIQIETRGQLGYRLGGFLRGEEITADSTRGWASRPRSDAKVFGCLLYLCARYLPGSYGFASRFGRRRKVRHFPLHFAYKL